MKVTVERIDNHKAVLEVEIPQEQVTKAVGRAYQKLAAKVNIPGFRKGKVPKKVLEMRIGKEAIMEEAFDLLASNAYSQALDEQNIEPVSRPQIEVVTLTEEAPCVFKATVTVKPEVTLGEYKNLKVAEVKAEVTDEEVDKQLEDMRSRQAKMVVVPDAVLEKGDFAIIDFEGFVDGIPFKGGDAQGYPLEVGSGSFIPGFEDQLIGAKSGEDRLVKVSFPEEYFSQELAGKAAEFKVKIQDIKRKELPALDDEFAKDSGEFETLEELRADTKNKLEEAAKEKAEREFKNNVIKLAVDNAQMDIPDVMVDDRINVMIQDLAVNLESRGMKLDKYLEYVHMDMNTLRENYRDNALANVKVDLLLEAIAKAEELKVETEDLDAETAAMAEAYQAPVEEVRKIITEQGNIGALAQTVLRKKALGLILDTVEKA
ncbi:MAG: trigger factor [Sporomusaceae bacterium]|nr:trigger factor [Sporomusaceae bacterium]